MSIEYLADESDGIIESALRNADPFTHAEMLGATNRVTGDFVIGAIVQSSTNPDGSASVVVRDRRDGSLRNFRSDDQRYTYSVESLSPTVAARIAREAMVNAVPKYSE